MQGILQKHQETPPSKNLSIERVGLAARSAWNSSKLPSSILYILAIKKHQPSTLECMFIFSWTFFNVMLSYVYIYIYISSVWTANFNQNKRNLSRQSEWILRWNAVKPCGFKQKWNTKLPPKTTSLPSRVSSNLLDRNSVISPTLPWSSSQVFPLDGVLHHLPQSGQGGTHHFTIQKHLQLTLREINNY